MKIYPASPPAPGSRSAILTEFFGRRGRAALDTGSLGRVIWSGHPAEFPCAVLPDHLPFFRPGLVKRVASKIVRIVAERDERPLPMKELAS